MSYELIFAILVTIIVITISVRAISKTLIEMWKEGR